MSARRPGVLCMAALACAALLVACGPAPRPVAPVQEPPPARSTYEIAGRVTLGGQSDSSGVHVFIPGTSVMAMTDVRGHFVLSGLGPGVYSIRAEHAGYQTSQIGDVEIPPGTPVSRFVLGEAELVRISGAPVSVAQLGSINGRLAGPEGIPVEALPPLGDARVELAGTAMRTFTDNDGAFFLWNIEPGTYSLRVRAQGYLDHAANIEVFGGKDPTRLTVILTPAPDEEEPTGMIRGQVSMNSENGDPLNEFDAVTVFLRELPARRATLDAEGRFTLDRLPPGVYTVLAEAPGFAPAQPVTADLTNQDEVEVLLELNAAEPQEIKPGRLTGRAVKADAPQGGNAGILVSLAGTGHTATTNGEGFWRMERVEPGGYEIIAQAAGYTPATLEGVEVESGAEVDAGILSLERELDHPVVLETTPSEGTKDFPVSREMLITVRFSKKMKPEELKRAVSVTPAIEWRAYAGREHKLSDYDLLVIALNGTSPERPVPFNTQVKVMIDTGAVDVQGVPLREPFMLSVRTGSAALIGSDPQQGSRDVVVAPGRPVMFYFNTRLKGDSVDARDFKFRPTLSATPTIQVIDDPANGWSSIQILSTWRPGVNYEVTLPRRIKAENGQSISNLPHTLKFRTADVTPYPELPSPRRR